MVTHRLGSPLEATSASGVLQVDLVPKCLGKERPGQTGDSLSDQIIAVCWSPVGNQTTEDFG
jgi:hypothetical protein